MAIPFDQELKATLMGGGGLADALVAAKSKPNTGMIFLLNQERVVYEVVELARLKMVGVLQVPSSAVEASLEMKDGKLVPSFGVNMADAEGVSEEQAKEVMRLAYVTLKDEMTLRMEGLVDRRGEEKEKETTAATEG